MYICKYIKVAHIQGVSCYVSRAKTGGITGAIGLAEDKSNASIACRQIGEISFKEPIKKQEDVAIYRNVYLIPNTGSKSGATMTQNSVIYNGVSPHLAWFGQTYIPNYWRPRYVTGWDKLPGDLFDFVCKVAALNILAIMGDVLYGVGITSISISLDGVSQNTPLTRSGQGGLFAGRIKTYIDDINNSILPNLKSKYRGISFEVL